MGSQSPFIAWPHTVPIPNPLTFFPTLRIAPGADAILLSNVVTRNVREDITRRREQLPS